jgi:vacuolar-type H+-ATPase subunit E/Vma4
LINRLNTQQQGIESIFKIYYDALDSIRNEMLGEEYKLRTQIADFENKTRKFVKTMENYSVYEFYTD